MKKRKQLWTILLTLLLVGGGTMPLAAQEFKYDVGGAAGVGCYLGDLNSRRLYNNSRLAVGALFRRSINLRWAVKGSLTTSSMVGDSSEAGIPLLGGAAQSFKRRLYDLGGGVEFNFWNYGMGATYLDAKRIAPYLTLGMGLSFSPQKGETFWAINLPLGAGVKYKLAPRWNLALEFTLRKNLGDALDGTALDDPYMITSRGSKNSDWHSFTLLSLSYDIGAKRPICNNLK